MSISGPDNSGLSHREPSGKGAEMANGRSDCMVN